ncbi:MAG: DUF2062 domain-containing protein [Pseudomonadota bacterium]|nr:DUF2062 domain-containing protein [Pseudomonadota bacterium]
MRAYIRRLRSWVHLLLREHLSPTAIGLAIGVGVFLGSLPIYGIHIFVCIAVARWLKLNQALVYAAANISNPFFAPFLISSQIAIGEWLRHGNLRAMGPELVEGSFWTMLRQAPDLFVSCLLGSVVMGAALGGGLGLLALVAARRWPRPPATAELPQQLPQKLPEGGAA